MNSIIHNNNKILFNEKFNQFIDLSKCRDKETTK